MTRGRLSDNLCIPHVQKQPSVSPLRDAAGLGHSWSLQEGQEGVLPGESTWTFGATMDM